jgi:photosystem II protein PsbQ
MLRPILAGAIAILMAIVFSWSTPPARAVANTDYSSQQIQQIEQAAIELTPFRQSIEDFEPLIEERQWKEIHAGIPGLIGNLRAKMVGLTDRLTPEDRVLARALATEVLIHLEKIDAADELKDYSAARTNYQQALQDFDALLTIVPKG